MYIHTCFTYCFIVQYMYKDGECMKKNKSDVYRMKLTNFEIRLMVNALNASRLEMNANGEDSTDVSNMILKLLDILEA